MNPVELWKEPRWTLTRTLLGDDFITKIVYEVITIIWKQNNRRPTDLQEYVVVNVFKANWNEFLRNKAKDTWSVAILISGSDSYFI